MAITPAQLGFIRAFGTGILLFVLAYLGDASHLSGVVSDTIALIISALALSLEHQIESNSGKALFGSTKVRPRF